MSDKHYVIVQEFQARPYLASGYARSEQAARDRLGLAWLELPDADRRDLIVLEIDAEKHALLNDTHPKKYRMYFGPDLTCFESVSVKSVRVLEEWPDNGVLIAREDQDCPPEQCGEHDLFDTPGQCIADKREFLLQMISRYRRAADTLETFLKHTEHVS